jgi:putative FmdB family regulatory protein
MPIYEYTCKDCSKTFELSRPIANAPAAPARCPSCGSEKTERTWSRVFAITGKKS